VISSPFKYLCAAILIQLGLGATSVNAGWFGPDDPKECVEKYFPKIRLSDARSLVGLACRVGYGNLNIDPSYVKAGKCVASGASDMYSFESALKVINKCSTDNIQFARFRNALYSDMNDAQERLEQQQRQNQALQEQQSKAPYTIFDINTGNLKVCQHNGNVITCF
jgi:hypothetical protein